ncbi:MAG: amidohydrolase family protein, partial [Planctomycetia bacterium]|nr:amidohydrolase family protein [Planctomycetia bacterium]
LYLDASMMWGEAIREVVVEHGPSRVLFGGAEPRNRYSVNLRTLDRLGLDEAARRAILHDNASRVFGV